MPSVIATISSTPAAAASSIESAANLGGTKIIAVLGWDPAIASAQLLKTGMPSTSCPPLPGVTPPTTLVP